MTMGTKMAKDTFACLLKVNSKVYLALIGLLLSFSVSLVDSKGMLTEVLYYFENFTATYANISCITVSQLEIPLL